MRHKMSIALGVALAGFAASSAAGQSAPPPTEVARTALMSEAPPPASAPIGSSSQTVPAKLSERNDLLDHVPMMAMPFRLNAQQRQEIYQAVMADASEPTGSGDTLKPADQISYEQTLEMHPLPQQVAQIDGLQGLQYIKTRKKVLLIQPAMRMVSDEIGG